MTEEIHLQCRVEKINGELVVRIALEDGCDEFIECSKGASRLEGDDLINIIPEFISETLAHRGRQHCEGKQCVWMYRPSTAQSGSVAIILSLRYHQLAVLHPQAGDPGRQLELLALLGQFLL